MKKSLDQFTVVYPKWQSYDVWLLRYGVQQTEFFVILDYFLPFYLLKTQGKFFLKKKTKKTTTPGDVILHMCTINENHMMHGSWDMECKRPNFFPFWTFFWPFTPLNIHKIRILKKMKKTWIIIILHRCTINDNHMMYDFWDMECNKQFFFFHFLPFYPTNNLKNKNFENFLEISFDMSGPQMTTTWYMALVIWSMTDIILCHFGLFLSFYLPSPP